MHKILIAFQAFFIFISAALAANVQYNGTVPYAITGGSTARTPATRITDYGLSLLDFGAACDQVNPDDTALQNTINKAGGTSTTPTSVSVILLPKRCMLTSGVNVFNRSGFPGSANLSSLIIMCVGAGSGLVWGGTDNGGDMFTFGDGTGADQGFTIVNCALGGKDTSHKPTHIFKFNSPGQVHVENNLFGYTHKAVECVGNCLFGHYVHNTFGGSYNDCILFSGTANSNQIRDNEFNACGRYTYEQLAGDTNVLDGNDHEGSVGSGSTDTGVASLGSIFIANGTARISDRHEDAATAAGTGFLPLTVGDGTHNAYVYDTSSSYGLNATYPGGPNFYAKVAASSSATFNDVRIANAPGSGSSGKYIDLESTSGVLWTGGFNCATANIYGGTQAASGLKAPSSQTCFGN